MNIRPFFAFQKAAFPIDFCDRVIDEGDRLPHDSTGTVGLGEGNRSDLELRSTELAFIPKQPMYRWVYEVIQQCINTGNNTYWNFRLTAIEPLQYGVYRPGQFYGWHADQHPLPYESGAHKGLTRKLSVSVQLSDGDEYEGGEFEFRDPGEDNKVETIDGLRARGSVVIFPSFVLHRVTPVTAGVRRSLVGWVLGPPFV